MWKRKGYSGTARITQESQHEPNCWDGITRNRYNSEGSDQSITALRRAETNFKSIIFSKDGKQLALSLSPSLSLLFFAPIFVPTHSSNLQKHLKMMPHCYNANANKLHYLLEYQIQILLQVACKSLLASVTQEPM
mmetsp:Transcript_11999/g.20348  ORF Transcript_11999/g.20348 Transcript_11999/m.20348 type:complete len:135 (+) Transcript_11999:1780-2184(+)